MGYTDFTKNFKFNDACIERIKNIEIEEQKHKNSKECTGEPDCPVCKKFNQDKIAESPNLP
ncbi:hypothetical protein FDB52_12090 [Clostridium botulinum]|nr:hypothetical protein [Clostridium botulinum]NFN49273.1 hypothetical protein [Clostridium botulinum]